MIKSLKHSCWLKYVGIGLVILGGMQPPSLAQETQQELPLVTAGTIPLYPRLALLARIQGVVKIKVTTDGKRVLSFNSESGPAMLVKAAKENIQTWEFDEHKPTSFVTTFEYRIEEPAHCGFKSGSAILHIPLEVDVSANGLQTCDPIERKSEVRKR